MWPQWRNDIFREVINWMCRGQNILLLYYNKKNYLYGFMEICLWQERSNEFSICVGLLTERKDRKKSRKGQFYSVIITHIFSLPALQISRTERFVKRPKSPPSPWSPLQSQSLFTRPLPEWKISSASVKISSKKEYPLPVSTNWFMK